MDVRKELPKLILGAVAFIGAVIAFIAFLRGIMIAEAFTEVIWIAGEPVPSDDLFASPFINSTLALSATLFLLSIAAYNILAAVGQGKIGAFVLIGLGVIATVFAAIYIIHIFSVTGESLDAQAEGLEFAEYEIAEIRAELYTLGPASELSGAELARYEQLQENYAEATSFKNMLRGIPHVVWAERFGSFAWLVVFGLVPTLMGAKKLMRILEEGVTYQEEVGE
ncbi:MAG: hypothetical protein FWB72_05125 [Firmicutes bacterium]|nr:hypothetical protein [Bacillota bacterium]